MLDCPISLCKSITTTSSLPLSPQYELGDYSWLTYSEVDKMASNFGRGLRVLGHQSKENIVIFAETRKEWLISAMGCFKQSFPLCTLYATLGDEAIVHGINETEVGRSSPTLSFSFNGFIVSFFLVPSSSSPCLPFTYSFSFPYLHYPSLPHSSIYCFFHSFLVAFYSWSLSSCSFPTLFPVSLLLIPSLSLISTISVSPVPSSLSCIPFIHLFSLHLHCPCFLSSFLPLLSCFYSSFLSPSSLSCSCFIHHYHHHHNTGPSHTSYHSPPSSTFPPSGPPHHHIPRAAPQVQDAVGQVPQSDAHHLLQGPAQGDPTRWVQGWHRVQLLRGCHREGRQLRFLRCVFVCVCWGT